MKIKITVVPECVWDKSDVEFEITPVETIETVRNVTNTDTNTYTLYVDSSYPPQTVAKNIRFIPQIDTAEPVE
jgi:hypothetical protein